MSKPLMILFGVILLLIILTWGSIGSAALTMGLLLACISIAMRKSMHKDVDDYFLEE